jgi:hypothetical protein
MLYTFSKSIDDDAYLGGQGPRNCHLRKLTKLGRIQPKLSRRDSKLGASDTGDRSKLA